MKLSTRSRYGARILLELARNKSGQPVKVTSISEGQKISIKYLEQLIRPLKKAGLIQSVRGPKGGHLLARKPQKISLGEVVRILEEKSDLVDCIFEPDACAISTDCRVRLAWKKASDAMYEKLDSISIADLAREETPPSCFKK